MPFTVEDRIYADPAVNRDSLAVGGLWVFAGSWSDAHGTCGAVPDEVLLALGGTPELRAQMIADGLASELRGGVEIRRGVFTDGSFTPLAEPATERPVETSARRMPCGRQSASSPVRNALGRKPELRQAVRDKYADQCQVCGVTVRWGKGRAADSGTYRLVDPVVGYSLENIIVACRSCGSSAGLAVGRQVSAETVPGEPQYGSGKRTGNPVKRTGTQDDDDFNHHHPWSGTTNHPEAGKRTGESVPGKRNAALTAAVIEAVREKTDGAVIITEAQAADAIGRIRERARRLGVKITNPLTYIPAVIMNEEDLFAEILCPPAAELERILAAAPPPPAGSTAGAQPRESLHEFIDDDNGSCAYPGCGVQERNWRHHKAEVSAA